MARNLENDRSNQSKMYTDRKVSFFSSRRYTVCVDWNIIFWVTGAESRKKVNFLGFYENYTCLFVLLSYTKNFFTYVNDSR